MKKIVYGIGSAVFGLLFLLLAFTANHLGEGQIAQTAAERWSDKKNVSQVSAFFSVNAYISEDSIEEFEHSIDQALTDAGIKLETENPGARLWVDAYSADGQISVTSDRTTISADAIGIGGDFFLFHPLKLLSGSYFSGNDLMQDYCVIDQDAAWQLFGSSNVAGMTVTIGGVPHIITGVVERGTGRLEKAAGLDTTLVYVSMSTLNSYGMSNGINHYEVLMPNPVTGFALEYVKTNLASNEKECEVIENTSRYSLISRLKLIPSFGTRAMNGRAIIYPYWENIARGYEDWLMIITFFEALFFVLFAVFLFLFLLYLWNHKGWTVKGFGIKMYDKYERFLERLRAKKQTNRKKGRKKFEERVVNFEDEND